MASTLRLPDDLNDALRAQAEIEDRSMQLVAQDAVREYINRRSDVIEVDEALRVLVPRREPTPGCG